MRKLFAIIVVALSMLFMAAVAQAEDMPAMAGDPGSASCNCPMMKDGDMMGKGMMGGGMPGGMMGKGMMGGGMMEHPQMHGMIEGGAMMGGLEMNPMLKKAFMRAMMKSMIRGALQDPEIKGFLDSTATLRKDLVLKRFEYFEAFRNPRTTPGELKKLKSEIKDLKKKIDEKMAPPAP
ncbi:MAG: hypothetical protein M0Z48_04790 [Nitrospiraceae bacterium]|nr:hypothetical protein [Nitrospiraceae bacterium]